jgi:hypothetical protein
VIMLPMAMMIVVAMPVVVDMGHPRLRRRDVNAGVEGSGRGTERCQAGKAPKRDRGKKQFTHSQISFLGYRKMATEFGSTATNSGFLRGGTGRSPPVERSLSRQRFSMVADFECLT